MPLPVVFVLASTCGYPHDVDPAADYGSEALLSKRVLGASDERTPLALGRTIFAFLRGVPASTKNSTPSLLSAPISTKPASSSAKSSCGRQVSELRTRARRLCPSCPGHLDLLDFVQRQKLLCLVIDQVRVSGWLVESTFRIPYNRPEPPNTRVSTKSRLRPLHLHDHGVVQSGGPATRWRRPRPLSLLDDQAAYFPPPVYMSPMPAPVFSPGPSLVMNRIRRVKRLRPGKPFGETQAQLSPECPT